MTDAVIVLSPEDSWLDAYCSTLGCSFGQILLTIDKLPSDNVNRPELLRYVARMRRSRDAQNMDAVEGWYNALIVSIKSASLLIPLATTMDTTTKRIKRVRQSGTQAGKDNAAAALVELDHAVVEYRKTISGTGNWFNCHAWIKRQPEYYRAGKVCGRWIDSTAPRYIKKALKKTT